MRTIDDSDEAIDRAVDAAMEKLARYRDSPVVQRRIVSKALEESEQRGAERIRQAISLKLSKEAGKCSKNAETMSTYAARHKWLEKARELVKQAKIVAEFELNGVAP